MALTGLEKRVKMKNQRGGRPRNAWTRSRIRKACKLYTFTPLKMEDIVKTLEAPGFSPKKRNVETTIFGVLAKIPNRSRTENSRLLDSWRELRKCRQLRRKRKIAVGRLSSQIQNNSLSVGLSTCPKVSLNPEKSARLADQVASICNSSSSSSRSSMVSWMSSLASGGSSIMGKQSSRSTFQNSSGISHDSRLEHAYHSQGKQPRSLQRPQAIHETNDTIDSSNAPSLLSSAEQEVWNQLIDEEALSHQLYQTSELRNFRRLKKPLAFTNIALVPFNCHCEGCESFHFKGINLIPYNCNCESCETIRSGVSFAGSRTCNRCGSSLMHRICRDFGYTLQGMEINARDYFDNGALHYLAEQCSPNFKEITHLILNGCDPRYRNTSGATFLHVLNWKYVWELKDTQYPTFEDFIGMVESLSIWNFNFDDCDYFGRTVAHKAFSAQVTMDEVHIRIPIVEQILSILKPDILKQDIFGVTVNIIICELEDRICDTRMYGVTGESVLALLTPYCTESNLRHEITLSESNHYLLAEDCEIPHECVYSIDNNGDTLLFRALKVWERNERILEMKIRELLRLGSHIHQRNRDGDTVLSVATSEGLPTIVSLLLSEGANPNSEQFHIFRGSDKSQSLLCHAELALALAKRQHDPRRYAGILSCIKLITEAGAVATPSLLQRWGNRTIREWIAREGEAFCSSRAPREIGIYIK